MDGVCYDCLMSNTASARQRISDRAMLEAAKLRLREHEALRPTSSSEALTIAAARRRAAIDLREYATRLRETQLAGGRVLQEALRFEADAARQDLHAKAWETIGYGSEGSAYLHTLRELRERVAYYQGLVDAARAGGVRATC